MTIPQTPNFEKELDKIIEELRIYFDTNKINSFLLAHTKISQLFTTKLQHDLDNHVSSKKEIKVDMNPDLLQQMKLFNENINKLNTLKINEIKNNGEKKNDNKPIL